ncbi:MAG: ABC transporter [Acidobacteria bacterium]|nr:MAG: ABC transporter [Acidobacteriota bacterium]
MSPDPAFLEVSQLRKTFGSQIAINDISFSVRQGEILGYLGPNGAGKSTTLKILAGLLTPDSGNISIGGINLQQDPLKAKKRMGFVPETGALYEKLTPLEYLEMVGQLYRIQASEIRRKSHEFLEYFDLAEQRNTRMTSFSKGMKQKVVLSAALLHNPDLLLLDEPLNGLDANTVLMFKGVMRRLADLGKTIIYSSHILEVVERVCDRIAIIHQGQIVAEGSITQLREMTQSPSLELIFKELTKTGGVEDKIEAFAKAITNGREANAASSQTEEEHEL